MATKHNIALFQGNDPTLDLTVKNAVGGAYPLTGQRVEILVKERRSTPDADALYTLSSVGASPKIVITNVAGGLATADFTDLLPTAGVFWYHAYVAATAAADLQRHTWSFGNLVIQAV